jgi:hypothetical protein
MKKIQMMCVLAVMATFSMSSLVHAAADNRRPFSLTKATIVEIVGNQVKVRNEAGNVQTFQVSEGLRAGNTLTKFKPGDAVRIQVQGNSLVQMDGNRP